MKDLVYYFLNDGWSPIVYRPLITGVQRMSILLVLRRTQRRTQSQQRIVKEMRKRKLSDIVLIILINVKMPTTVGILTFMIMIDGMLI